MENNVNFAHFGDPCIYCHTPHDDVPSGPCVARLNDYKRGKHDGLMMACDIACRFRDQLGDFSKVGDTEAALMRALDALRIDFAERAVTNG